MITIIEPSYEILTSLDGLTEHIEKCGRVCYKSESRITPSSAEKFVRSIVKSGHESVIEHAGASVRIICSRACSHQLVRHRICTFSQESQRFCSYGKHGSLKIICPPSIGLDPANYVIEYYENYGWVVLGTDKNLNSRQDQWLSQINSAYKEYKAELAEGVKPEDARYILPNASKTELIVTANLRQWRTMFKQRALNKHAQWEIRNIFSGILNEFIEALPAIFGDLEGETLTEENNVKS